MTAKVVSEESTTIVAGRPVLIPELNKVIEDEKLAASKQSVGAEKKDELRDEMKRVTGLGKVLKKMLHRTLEAK